MAVLAVLCLQKLWSVDTILWLSVTINETLKWLSPLPILMQESFWWWQCSHTRISIAPGFLVHPLPLTSVTCPQDLLLRFHCPSSLPDMNCLFVCSNSMRFCDDSLMPWKRRTGRPHHPASSQSYDACVPCMGCGVWRDNWPRSTKVRWPFCCLS